MKPYYDHAGIQIFNADCRDILPQLEPVDLVLTDPPYGIGKAEWDREWLDWCVTACLDAGQALCILPGLWNLDKCIRDMGSAYKWIIAGHNKNGMTYGAIGFGNWIPAVLAGDIKHGGMDAFDFTVGKEAKYPHPDQKPLMFIRQLIKRLTEADQTILDPFVGSGTTLVAAKEFGIKAIGIEIDEQSAEIAVNRLEQEVFSFTESRARNI